jgi:hypothetical protein
MKVKSPNGFFRLGNTCCIGLKGKIFLTIGPDWPLNLLIILLLTSANVFFIKIMAPKVAFTMQCLGFFIYSGCFCCYILTAFKNQGILLTTWEQKMEEGESHENICPDCEVITETGSEHCCECGICIKGYDHHCALSGKCIGSGNIVPFYLFLVLIFSSIVYFCIWFLIAVSTTLKEK